MASVKNSVWVGELERFGYNLIAVGRTEEEVRDAIMKAYIKTYKDLNDGANPKEEICSYYTDGTKATYYEVAESELYVREMAFGRVEWA